MMGVDNGKRLNRAPKTAKADLDLDGTSTALDSVHICPMSTVSHHSSHTEITTPPIANSGTIPLTNM